MYIFIDIYMYIHIYIGIVKDSKQDLAAVLQIAISSCDVIVTSGGVSMVCMYMYISTH
jgi:molybdopterin biosynthesis enzyme